MAKPNPNDTRSVGKYEQEQKNTKGMKKTTPLMKHKEKKWLINVNTNDNDETRSK